MSNFEKEDRYIVIKLKNLTHMQEKHLRACLYCEGIQTIESVVVEHDWPEYHMVWSMLKHRMAGKTVPDFDIWRSADALQQRLTVAEQRVYLLEGLLKSGSSPTYAHCSAVMEALKPAAEPDHICEGCGSKGWTANCDKCVPY